MEAEACRVEVLLRRTAVYD